jgi:molecular chaperone DnaK (HSP70)
MFDRQREVEVTVYQGEDPDALNNIEIGRFRVEGLSQVPAGNPIVLQLALDLNGILEVTAREKRSGVERSITIANAMPRFEDARLAEARQRVSELAGGDAAAPAGSAGEATDAATAERRQGVEAQALIEKAERALEQASGDDASDLVDAIEAVKDAMEGDAAQLKAAMDALADLLYYLEA